MNGFRTHDLRRTVGTGLGSLGTQLTVVKKVLNHSEKSSVTSIYDRHGYDKEKRSALNKWETIVEFIAGDAVTGRMV